MKNTLSRIALSLATLALTLGLGAGLAAADDSAKNPPPAEQGGKLKVKTLVFGEGSDVEGTVIGPDGDDVKVRGEIIHSNLIRVRTDFIREIFKSAENL